MITKYIKRVLLAVAQSRRPHSSFSIRQSGGLTGKPETKAKQAAAEEGPREDLCNLSAYNMRPSWARSPKYRTGEFVKSTGKSREFRDRGASEL